MTIEQICKKYNITNYTINSDGSIDVDGNVDLYDNGLTELPLTFNRVSGHFVCSWNCLTTLKGSPKWVGDRFSCNDNQLTSLEFGPEYVNKGFNCSYNDLTDLIGSPKKIGGYFMVEDNKLLKNPKGCTEKIGGLFHCRNTPFGSIFNVVDQNFLHAFNFYKIIKDDTVNLKRLKYVMDLYDLPIDLDKIEKYYRIV